MAEPVVPIGDGRYMTVGTVSEVLAQRDRDPSIHALHLQVIVDTRLGRRIYVFGSVEQAKIAAVLDARDLVAELTIDELSRHLYEFDWRRVKGRKVWIEVVETGSKQTATWCGLADPEGDVP